MKAFVVIILLIMTTIGLKAQSEKFYVNESEVTKENAIVYSKFYRSKVTITHKKDFIEIKTDSVTFKSFVLRNNKPINNGLTYRSLLAAHREQVFFIKEFTHNERWYLVVLPVKLTMYHRKLGGYGLRLIISNVEIVNDSLKFVKN